MGASELRVVPATVEHARALAPKLRAADLAEIRASHGPEPVESLLLHGLETSTTCRALLADGEVAALCGVTSLDFLSGQGMLWLLTGEAVDEHPTAFLRASRRQMDSLLALWPELFCAIDARYTKAVRFARWLGFEVLPPIPLGPQSAPFHPAIIRRTQWPS